MIYQPVGHVRAYLFLNLRGDSPFLKSLAAEAVLGAVKRVMAQYPPANHSTSPRSALPEPAISHEA